MFDYFGHLPSTLKIPILIALVIGAHVVVILVRHLGSRIVTTKKRGSFWGKLRSIASIVTSGLVFVLYFLALGLILTEFGVSLTAYLASASIVGLAVGFGSQGLVQDVMTGLTLIFSDLFDVGEMVEISGQSGIVKSIGMRFVELENSFGARIFIPNRTIINVVNYPRGYVRYIADVTLSNDSNIAENMIREIETAVSNVDEQFPGILLTPPSIESRIRTSAGKEFLRIKFRIWPNRGDPIDKTFRSEVLDSLRKLDPEYGEWGIAVYYEVEKK